MASMNTADSYRSSQARRAQARAAAPSARPRYRARVTQAIASALRPHMEAMEGRVLLSAYALSRMGNFGINDTGAEPASTLVSDAAGNLYGTTSAGGPYGWGTVFEMANGSNTITTLASFHGSDGAGPTGSLAIDSSGDLFGVTAAGGSHNFGTVFELAKGSNVITTLTAFNANEQPQGVTLDAAGDLFGTTRSGGPVNYNDGTVFEFPEGSATLTTVAAFAGSNGANPYASVTVDASGNLYGTTYSGGANGYGTAYEIASGSGTITTLGSFNRTNGSYPEAGVTLDASGNLFGTTHSGGAYGYGTIFEIAQGSTTITTLVPLGSYSGGPYPPTPEGANSALVLDASGNLYGTSDYGGRYLEGTVFELARGTTAATTLTSFNYNDRVGMSRTVSSLVRNASGNIYGAAYGMTPLGAPERNGLPEPTSNGTVFEIAGGTSATTTIASFEPIDGESPTGSLAEDAAGNVFGMTSSGGSQLCGTLYEVAAGTSSISLVASFAGATALNGGSVKDAAGDSYGVTLSGGPDGAGTVFETAAGSTVTTTLASFDTTDGAYPVGLALDASGNIYGTTAAGADHNEGGMFEVVEGSNAITDLASFANNGAAGMAFDALGNLYGVYGTTGVSNNVGKVFEIAKGTSTQTTLVSFNLTNYDHLATELAVDAAGNIYGTQVGGTGSYGSVFEIAKGSGAATTLASFNRTNGSTPPAGVIMDASGNLFGTTTSGGAYDDGTVFEIPSGSTTITTVVSFDGSDEAFPTSGVALDARGNLLGTTSQGGAANLGTVFELAANTAVTLVPSGGANPAPVSQPLTFTAIVGGGVPDGEAVSLVDASNNNAVVTTGTVSGGSATLTVPAGTLTPGTHSLIAAYAGDANFAASESASYAQTILAPPPALAAAPVVNGDNPNGLFNAAGQTTPGTQRSMVEDIVYTFNEPVTITDANQAFTLAVAGPAGGTLPATLYAQAVTGSNGTQWAVSLTGQPEGTIGSIANGEYRITINPAYVLAAADGVTSMAPGTGRTDTFYRLYGDIFGTESVTNADYNLFKKSINTYNPGFDYFANGQTSSNADYNVFKKDLNISYYGDGFVTTV